MGLLLLLHLTGREFYITNGDRLMQPYRNLSGQSNVKAYQLGGDFIIVEFMSGRETIYEYTYVSAGMQAIETMKNLAIRGSGLNSYISTHKPGYASKR
jgi:hypothetical protein